MKNTKRKILSLLLTAAMVCSLMPNLTLTAWAASTPSSCTFDISEGNITVSAGTDSGTLKVAFGSSQTLDNIVGTQVISIIGNSTANTITVASAIPQAVNITLSGANIDVSGATSSCAFSIASGSTVNLTLSGDNILKSGANYAGLQVPDGATLNIAADSTGSLAVTGGGSGAGIGGNGGNNGSAGTSGNNDGTSGGNGGDGGIVTIAGGTITANGGGAGIGGGAGGSGGNGILTTIGGIYTSGSGGVGGAGGSGGSVTITGGIITANGGSSGIGGGNGGTGGNASSTSSSQGKGGTGGSGGTVTITGGTVTANGGGVGIGGGTGPSNTSAGSGGNAGAISISGGTVTATGDNAGIGGGSGGAVIVGGSSIGTGGIGIEDGSGGVTSTSTYASSGNDGTVTITGGTVILHARGASAVPLCIATSSLPVAVIGTAYSQTLTAVGGTAPYTWSVDSLPSGLSLDTATGIISGIPTATGTYTVKATVTDNNSNSVSKDLTLTVYATSSGAAPYITVANGVAFSVTLHNTGGSYAGINTVNSDGITGTITGTVSGSDTILTGTLTGVPTTWTEVTLTGGKVMIRSVTAPSTTVQNPSFN